MHHLRLALVAFAVASLFACDPGGSPPSVDCNGASVPRYSELTMITSCTNCHSSTASGAARHGAPTGVDYDTYAAAKRNANAGATAINDGFMPPGDALSTEDEDAFFAWAMCGTPQ